MVCRSRSAGGVSTAVEFFGAVGPPSRKRMVGFSKGMKQWWRSLARYYEPAALFLDEPTSGLDPLARGP